MKNSEEIKQCHSVALTTENRERLNIAWSKAKGKVTKGGRITRNSLINYFLDLGLKQEIEKGEEATIG